MKYPANMMNYVKVLKVLILLSVLSLCTHGSTPPLITVIEGDTLVCITPLQVDRANEVYIDYQECKEQRDNLKQRVIYYVDVESVLMRRLGIKGEQITNLLEQVTITKEIQDALFKDNEELIKDNIKKDRKLTFYRIFSGTLTVVVIVIIIVT